MKGLQSKCLIVSAVTHGLLLGLVLIGSAFLPQPKPSETVSFTLMAIPDMLIDEPNMVGGGNPKAGLPNVEPAPQPVVQPPAPAARQEPAQPQIKPPEPKPESKPEPKPEKSAQPEPPPVAMPPDATPRFDLDKAVTKKAPSKTDPSPAKTEPSFDLGKATRKKITPSSNSSKSAKDSQSTEPSGPSEREMKVAGALGQAAARMSKGLSTGVGEIGIPGPGGPAYASYNLALKKFYEDHWITPQTYSDNDPVVVTEVTIQGDGSVLSARIIQKSNKRALDDSVQKTLDRVKKVPPFPSGNGNEKRTFKINFSLSSKLNLG